MKALSVIVAALTFACGGASDPNPEPAWTCDASTGTVTIPGPVDAVTACYDGTWIAWSGANLVTGPDDGCALLEPARPVPAGDAWTFVVHVEHAGPVCPIEVRP